jgi:hypothetical protein
MNNRAFSILEIKSVDEEKRIIRGVATTPTVDRVGDIIDPLGVKFDNPLPCCGSTSTTSRSAA